MKFLIIYVFIALFSYEGCNIKQGNENNYLITDIKFVNNWNVIYATKDNVSYKIVTPKVNGDSFDCNRIEVGKSYKLLLNSRKNNVPEINGIKVSPVNSLDVQCYDYDEDTSICIEPDKGINDLHHTDNIEGLCYKR